MGEFASPVPIFIFFKWQFENTIIFNFQLLIVNSPATGCMWRTMFAATGELQRGAGANSRQIAGATGGRGTAGEQGLSLQAGLMPGDLIPGA